MHSLLLLAPFIALTSAIDIRIHYENNGKCNNSNYISCRNMNPNDCCVTPSGPKTDQAQAFGFAAIPTNWNIHSKAYTARGCPGNRVKNDFWSGGRRDMCHGTNINNFAEYMSASYSFGQRKMANGDDGEAPKVREPDVMFVDGAQYDLSAMDEKSVIYMYELLANGTDAADVPTQFDEFKQE